MWQCLYPLDCILYWIYGQQINYITLHYITWNNWSWNACVPDNFSTNRTHTIRPTSTPLDNSSSVLHGFLGLHDEMRPIFTHPSVRTLHWQLEWNWQDRRKFWQTMENTKNTGNSIQHIFKSLQHFQRSGSRKVCFSLQRKAVLKQCTAKTYKCFSMKIYELCFSTGYTYNIKGTWGRTYNIQHNSWQQHMPQGRDCLLQ